MDVILCARDIKKTFNDGKENRIQVIKEISFSAHRGEKIAIIGQSGSGKSTLLNILGLLLDSDSGELQIMGRDVNKMSFKQKALIRNEFFGYVVQDFALVEEDTSFQNIELPLLYSNKKMNKSNRAQLIEQAIKRVRLEDKVHEKVKNLSGGQRQRIAIARAIVNNPSIILADEPTGALDSETSSQVLAVLNSLVLEGKSIVIVTHNMSIANTCDKQFVLNSGNLEQIK